MDDKAAIHKEIGHLRTLAALSTDPKVLAEIEAMIRCCCAGLGETGKLIPAPMATLPGPCRRPHDGPSAARLIGRLRCPSAGTAVASGAFRRGQTPAVLRAADTRAHWKSLILQSFQTADTLAHCNP